MGKNKIINLAQKQIGVVHGDKYHKQIIDGYNKITPRPVGYAVKSYDDWCDVFVTWLADKTGQANLIGRECGVQRHLQIFKQKGIWKGRVKPQAGDIIVFDWQGYNAGWADHIGIVEKVSGNTVHTIEGNTGSPRAVRRKTYPWNSTYIVGYARPNYATSTNKPVTPSSKSIDQLAREAMNGEYGDGEARKKALGDKYDAVQKRVNELSKTVQKPKNNLALDGYLGPDTVKVLQRYFGLIVDGEIWGQYSGNQATKAFNQKAVKYGKGGSPVVKALQKKIGVTADGVWGANTTRALQRYLGTPVDGIISRPSTAIKELQRRLNNGTF